MDIFMYIYTRKYIQVLQIRTEVEQSIRELLPFLKCSPRDAALLTARTGRLEWAIEMCLSRAYTVNAVSATYSDKQTHTYTQSFNKRKPNLNQNVTQTNQQTQTATKFESKCNSDECIL